MGCKDNNCVVIPAKYGGHGKPPEKAFIVFQVPKDLWDGIRDTENGISLSKVRIFVTDKDPLEAKASK